MVAFALHYLNTFTVIHGICYLLHLHSFGHLHCICLAQRGAEGVGDSQGWAQIWTQLGQILPHLGPHPKTPLGRAPKGILSPGAGLGCETDSHCNQVPPRSSGMPETPETPGGMKRPSTAQHAVLRRFMLERLEPDRCEPSVLVIQHRFTLASSKLG
jgi:hypothetical protein